ncbi:MAG: septum formation family protein [Microbacteriaceae bacterium]
MTLRSTLIAVSTTALLVVGLAGCSLIGDAVGKVVDVDGDTSAFDVSVGDCVNDAEATDAEEVANVTIVKCTVEHDYEAYKSIVIPEGAFPGSSEIETTAGDGCQAAFDGFVGTPYDESTLDFTYLAPTSQSWDEGDREILCMLVDVDENGDLLPSSVSLENSKR